VLIRHKLIYGSIAFAAIPVLATAAIIGWLTLGAAGQTIEEKAQKELTAQREIKAAQIENYFETIRKQIITYANNPMTLMAMREFNAGFSRVVEQLQPELDAEKRSLEEYYRQDFARQYNVRNVGSSPNLAAVSKNLDAQSVALQYRYIKANPNPLGQKDAMMASKDDSDYSRTHGKYHAHIRQFLTEFG